MVVKRHDSDSGARLYSIPTPDGGERKVPSVTTVLNLKGKPALVSWAAKVERALVVEASADLYDDLPLSVPKKMSRMAYVDTLTKRIPLAKAHQIETEKAFETGRLAHEMVEYTLRQRMNHAVGEMPRLNEEAAFAFAAWEKWAEETHFTPKYIEQVLYSQEFGYAGTADVIAEIQIDNQPVLAVGDWKTSKAIYDEYGLQVAAYAHALLEMGHATQMPYAFVSRFPKTKHDAAFETRIWTPDELNENLRIFLCLLQVWQWQNDIDTKKKEKKTK